MRQKQALQIMMSGNNIFLTGAPGAGKTYVLNEFIHRAQRLGKNVAVTASTGIAATHLGGNTIHSWSGLGIRDQLSHQDRVWLVENELLIKRYNKTDILVIDEVSMLHGKRLDMINEAAKLLRDNDRAFGGIQVILVGDLFQLPPISRNTSEIDFIHKSTAWDELEPEICYLTEQHRQGVNDGLLNLLEAMRQGELEIMHHELLNDRLNYRPVPGQPITRLYSHNIDVESINLQHLNALPTKGKSYHMQSKGRKNRVEQLIKSILAPEELVLKLDAEVMFVANNFSEGYVNGSRGKIVRFDDNNPIVMLTNGRRITVGLHSWSLNEDGRSTAEITQLPLRLAWAITIHKSQGMSIDAAEVDLSKAFTPGMGYVALSRIRSLEGLYLKGINNIALQMHPQVYEFDRQLKQSSQYLELGTLDIEDEVRVAHSKNQLNVNDELYEKLKAWRLNRSRIDGVAPFMIAHNSSLELIAALVPKNSKQLLTIHGFGKIKVELYGPEILAITAS